MKIGDSSDVDQNESTRKLFQEKLKKGELDERKIEIDIKGSGGTSANIGVMGPMGMDDNTMLNIQDMIEGMMPKRHKKRKMTIADARKVILEEESAKLIDMDEVKELAIHRAENTGIIFIDEIDKIASSSNNSGEVSRQGVQRDLLPIVEGSAVNTKHGIVNTDHILFIAAGAFHVAKPSDLIP
jgi:ATP-dependent HslUV protease ATP-binding subunit HslU